MSLTSVYVCCPTAPGTIFSKFYTNNKRISPKTAPSPPAAQKSTNPAPAIPTLADFDVLKPIGKGATSRVFLVRHKLTQKKYALKVAPKASKTSSDLPLEQAMLRSISQDGSPFLLRLVASWDDSANYYLLTPWCEGGDLASILLQGQLPRERATQHLAQLILALEDLHSRRILHRDVKPSNIFVDGWGNAILGDLGYGKRFAFSADPQEPDFVEFNADPEATSGSFRWQECVTAERCGTPAFMAPQQHYGEEYSFDVDVWGLGMCFFYMLTGRSPFAGNPRTPDEFARTFKAAPVRFEEADGLDEDVRYLVQSMLSKNGWSRATLPEIKNHAVFASVDWAALGTGTLPTAWAPRALHVPRTPRPDLVVAGEPYAPDLHPEPQFSFVKSNFVDREPEPEPRRASPVKAWLGRVKTVFQPKVKTSPVPAPPPVVATPKQQPAPVTPKDLKPQPLLAFVIQANLYPGFDYSTPCAANGDTDPSSDPEKQPLSLQCVLRGFVSGHLRQAVVPSLDVKHRPTGVKLFPCPSAAPSPACAPVTVKSAQQPPASSKASKRLSHTRHKAVLDGQQQQERPDLPCGLGRRFLLWARRCLRGKVLTAAL